MRRNRNKARVRRPVDEDHNLIDEDGFRANVGMVLLNDHGQVFWGRRVGNTGWQFPQGGIRPRETPRAAMFRELHEEVGLSERQVEIIGCTRQWLRYRLPERYIRRDRQPLCIGQKQIWFGLRLTTDDCAVCLDHAEVPEFQEWRWVDYWRPAREVIRFKRAVYRQALMELADYARHHPEVTLPGRPAKF